MAYQRRNFQAGQKVKSADLNAMDMQIEENEKRAAEAETIASSAERKATSALENSANWTEVILDARQASKEAKQASKEAKQASETAASVASDAKTTADNAASVASDAKTTADNAASAATNAESAANEAKSLVQSTNNAGVFTSIYTSGVFADVDKTALKPTPGDGLKVVCEPGAMMIGGIYKKVARSTRSFKDYGAERAEVNLYRLYEETGEIVNLWREVNEHGDVLLSTEDAAELPVRWGGRYDILICKVKFPAGTTQITEDMITDLRADPKYCGFVEAKHDPMRQQLMTLIGMLYTNGVLEDGTNPMRSSAANGMRLTVKPGNIVFDGALYTQAETIAIGFAVSSEKNIIALGYRYDRETGAVHELRAENCIEQGSLLIRRNAYGEYETLPSRNDAVYDVIHTVVRIPANADAITQSMIQDMRPKQEYCGYAKFRMIGM